MKLQNWYVQTSNQDVYYKGFDSHIFCKHIDFSCV